MFITIVPTIQGVSSSSNVPGSDDVLELLLGRLDDLHHLDTSEGGLPHRLTPSVRYSMPSPTCHQR